MSRHRDVRNLDYDQEYDDAYDDAVYGHSVDEHEYGVSPSTAQYLYSQKDASYGIGAYFPETENIREEEDESLDEGLHSLARRDSSNFERPRLSSEDEVRLNSVLDEIRNVVGDEFSDAEMVRSVLDHNYDFEASLSFLLEKRANVGPPRRTHPSAAFASSTASPAPTQPPSTKSKKEFASRGSQSDDSIVLCPFSFMLPLSYSFSSAFSFETGKLERIPVGKMVKEWHSNVLRTRAKEDKKISSRLARESSSFAKEAVLGSPRSSSLSEIDDSRDDSDSLSVEISNLSVQPNHSASASVSEDSLGVSLRGQVGKEVDGLVSKTVKCAEGVNDDAFEERSRVKNVPSSLSRKMEFGIPPLGTLSSSPSLGKETSHIPPLGSARTDNSSYDFNFRLPSFPNVKESQSNVELLDKRTPSGALSAQNTTTSKLASLVSAHFKQVGKSLPMTIGTPLNSSSPPSHSSSPLDRRSNLSALASAHFSQTTTKLGAIPTLSSASPSSCESKEDGFDLKRNLEPENVSTDVEFGSYFASRKNETFSTSKMIPPLTLKSFSPPALDSSHDDSISMGNEKEDPFSISEDSLNMEVDNFSVTGKEVDFTIDLKVALNKNKPTAPNDEENRPNSLKRTQLPSISLSIERLPNLLKRERYFLLREPPSLFGRALLKWKRGVKKRRVMYSRNVMLPLRPYDFSSQSPDDIVKSALADSQANDLFKLIKREKRKI